MNDVIIMNGKDFVAKIKEAMKLLEENGYKVTAPPKEVKDEYTFERAWNLYEKKVGCKAKLEKKWNSMSQKDRKAAIELKNLFRNAFRWAKLCNRQHLPPRPGHRLEP